MIFQPLVSIITTAYNYERYLGDLVRSIVAQDYENWEWIVVDDCSDDNPGKILNQHRDTRIQYIRLGENMGYSYAKNVGIRASKGTYIVMIDADDMLVPESLSLRLRTLRLHPNKLWIHAKALKCDRNGILKSKCIDSNNKKRKECKKKGVNLAIQYDHRLVHAQTVMVRRRFHTVLGLYDETLRFSSDNEMWRRAIRFGYIPSYIPHPVSIYRIHNKRMSRSSYKKKRVAKTKIYIKAVVEKRFKEGINSNNTMLLGAIE